MSVKTLQSLLPIFNSDFLIFEKCIMFKQGNILYSVSENKSFNMETNKKLFKGKYHILLYEKNENSINYEVVSLNLEVIFKLNLVLDEKEIFPFYVDDQVQCFFSFKQTSCHELNIHIVYKGENTDETVFVNDKKNLFPSVLVSEEPIVEVKNNTINLNVKTTNGYKLIVVNLLKD